MASFIKEIIHRHAGQRGNAIALIEAERRLTWQQVENAVASLSRRLIAEGVGPETRVGVCCKRASDMVLSMLGIMAAGGTYLPLDCLYPPDRIQFMVKDAGARLALIDPTTQKLFDETAGLRFLEISGSANSEAAQVDASPTPSL